MGTVVDALNLTRDFFSHDLIANRGSSLSENDRRGLADLVTDQMEFAVGVVPNKVSDAGPARPASTRRAGSCAP